MLVRPTLLEMFLMKKDTNITNLIDNLKYIIDSATALNAYMRSDYLNDQIDELYKHLCDLIDEEDKCKKESDEYNKLKLAYRDGGKV